MDRFSETSPGDFYAELQRSRDGEMFDQGETVSMPESDAGDENPAPETCPVRLHVLMSATTLGEMWNALDCHRLEYCEACGQLDGFVRRAA